MHPELFYNKLDWYTERVHVKTFNTSDYHARKSIHVTQNFALIMDEAILSYAFKGHSFEHTVQTYGIFPKEE